MTAIEMLCKGTHGILEKACVAFFAGDWRFYIVLQFQVDNAGLQAPLIGFRSAGCDRLLSAKTRHS